jgi:NTE family protein
MAAVSGVRTTAIGLAALLCVASGAGEVWAQPAAPRPKVGVALGGGSARGLAHVGVLRWLEEHRIPIDVITGTSMGGLIGGSYATGMTPDEIETMLESINWDSMFGASRFEFLNVRRKRDLRAYPARLEFGLRRGIVPPPSLNNGQQVDLLLSRIAGAYYGITNFDELPTPFRCVAVDLRRAEPVVLRDGSLARSMRATMSLPLVFPPVTVGDRVLVDGGAMNNIPADVARAMGAARVVAVNVGEINAKENIDYSLVGLVMETLDAMMRANTLRATTSADVLVTVPLSNYGSLDWRRAGDLIKEGYAAAEASRDRLLPLAIDEAAWQQWREARDATRRRAMPVPAFVEVTGAGRADADRMLLHMQRHVGAPFDYDTIEESIRVMGGLDRYETLSWELVARGSDYGLVVTARPKNYGPPFMYLGVSLENTTSNEFRFGLGGRYLAFDVLGSGTELRIDANVGSDPSLGAAWYRPLLTRSFFINPLAGIGAQSFYVIEDERTTATYQRTRVGVGADVGVNIGRFDEVRAGLRYGWTAASVRVGDPGLPEIDGEDTTVHTTWSHDAQDDPTVPSRGLRMEHTVRHYISAPIVANAGAPRTSEGATQAEGAVSWAKSFDRTLHKRLFAGGSAGTSFDTEPLPTEQFPLGGPLRMSAYSVGQKRGDHFGMASLGYLHQVMRLPDFLGGPVFIGGWTETGAAFNDLDDIDMDVHGSIGVIADTLIGPIFAGASAGLEGDSRFYIGIGRLFR